MRRPLVIVPLLLALLALLAAGCGSDRKTSSTAGSGGNGGGGASAGTTVTAVQGVDIESLDPMAMSNDTTVTVLRHIYDPLIARDPDKPEQFTPVLATSWEQVNPKTMRFKLREGVKFSDGQPFDANSVKYTVEYLIGKLPGMKAPPLYHAVGFDSIAGARVIDSTTVDVLTKYPDALLPSRMAAMLIVPDKAIATNPNALKTKPVGTGPYELVRWDRNDQVVLKAKPDYFLGKPNIPNVAFKVMPDASARLAALEAGNVDIIVGVPPDNIDEVKSSDRAGIATVPGFRIAQVWLNTLEKGPMADPRVRQALNYAVDVNTIIKTVGGGYAQRVATMVPPYFQGYDPSVSPFPYDVAKAKELLKEAGYAQGFKLTWLVPTGKYPFGVETMQAVASYLEKIGVHVKLKVQDAEVWGKATIDRTVDDGFFAAWGENYFNPINGFQVCVRSGTEGFSWFHDAETDRLIDTGLRTMEPAAQDKIITKIQQRLLADPPFLYLFAYKNIYGVSKRLTWKPQSDEMIYLYDAKLKA